MKVFKYTLLAILFFVCVAHLALGSEVSSEALAEVDQTNALQVSGGVSVDIGKDLSLLETDSELEVGVDRHHHHHHHHHRRRRARRRHRRRHSRRHRRRHSRRHRRRIRRLRRKHRRHRRKVRRHRRKARRHAKRARGPSASAISKALSNARRQHNARCASSCKTKASRRYPAFIESSTTVTSTAAVDVSRHRHRHRRHRRRHRHRFLRRLRRRLRHRRRHRRRHARRRRHRRRHAKKRSVYRAKSNAYAALNRRVQQVIKGPCNCRSAMLLARRRQSAIRARRAAAAARRRRNAMARKMRLAAIKARRAAAAARRRARKAAAARRRAAAAARKLVRSVPRRYRRKLAKKLKRKLVKKVPHPKHRASTRSTHNKLDNAIAKVHRATASLAKLKKKMHAMRKALSSKSLHTMMKMETEGAVARYLKKIGYSTDGAKGAKTIRQWKEHQAIHGRKYKYIATEEPVVYLPALKRANDVGTDALAQHETTLYFLDDQQIAENNAKKLKRAGLLNGRTN